VTREHFAQLAGRYDELRHSGDGWAVLVEAIWREGDLAGRRVLDVGCGTGRLAAELAGRGARVWGVDPSAEMLAVARSRAGRNVGLKQGAAEQLPFRDGWFERAVLRMVVHLVDRERALPELARVLGAGGRAVVATFRAEHFDGLWLSPYFPSVAALDRARFPDPDLLAAELLQAGFAGTRRVDLTVRQQLSRADALDRLRGRYISTLALIPESELRTGIELAERELPDALAYDLAWTLVVADR
jgi:SAM-dependent methyltransferase